ncbi:MAG: hypothetical protein IPJ75_19505 [Ignavibacteriales bacterium]|nr:hypothetical protein [Ignavibacteriales bacterium]
MKLLIFMLIFTIGLVAQSLKGTNNEVLINTKVETLMKPLDSLKKAPNLITRPRFLILIWVQDIIKKELQRVD